MRVSDAESCAFLIQNHGRYSQCFVMGSNQIFLPFQIIIHRYQEIARFGVMHSIAVNLCVWFRTLVDETIDEFSRKWSGEGADAKDSTAGTGKGVPDAQLRMMAEDAGWHGPAPASSAGLHGACMTINRQFCQCSNHVIRSLFHFFRRKFNKINNF